MVTHLVNHSEVVVVRERESFIELEKLPIDKNKLLLGIDYAFSLNEYEVNIESNLRIDSYLEDLPQPILGVNFIDLNCFNKGLKEDNYLQLIHNKINEKFKTRIGR